MQDSVFVQGENSRLASRVSTNRQKRRSEERQTGRKKNRLGEVREDCWLVGQREIK